MKLLLLVPLAVFVALAGVFAVRVQDGADREAIPSALVGQPVPAERFPALGDAKPGIDQATFAGRVTLVNVFASWCAPCRVEHPQLMALAERPGLTLAGVNYKDRVPAARAFLAELGDPFDLIGVDPDGRRALEWGLTGVPESYLVGPDGTVRAKHVGVIDETTLAGPFGRTLDALLSEHRPQS